MSNINTMNNNQNRGKIAYEKVLALVRKTKELSEVVKLGIRDLNNSTKDRSDKAIEDKAKIVDIAKLKYQKALEENQALSAEVESGKCRLNEVTLEYQAILEANNSFKKEEYALSNQTDVHADDQKRIDELRHKLKLYKKMTGIRFDLYAPQDVLSGYVGIKGLTPSESTIVPFTILKSEANITERLWEKIGEACDETKENMKPSNVVSEFQDKLRIK